MRLVWSLRPGDTRCFKCGQQPVHQGVCRRCREWCLFGPRVGPRLRAPQLKDIADVMVLRAVRDCGGEWPYETLARWTGYPEKLCLCAMARADRRGLLDHGVSLRTAWLTDAGKALLDRPA